MSPPEPDHKRAIDIQIANAIREILTEHAPDVYQFFYGLVQMGMVDGARKLLEMPFRVENIYYSLNNYTLDIDSSSAPYRSPMPFRTVEYIYLNSLVRGNAPIYLLAARNDNGEWFLESENGEEEYHAFNEVCNPYRFPAKLPSLLTSKLKIFQTAKRIIGIAHPNMDFFLLDYQIKKLSTANGITS